MKKKLKKKMKKKFGDDKEEVWVFNFLVENVKDKMMKRSKADKLMNAIVSLVEEHNCQMAGNYRALTEEEKNDEGPFYELRS
jgi:hypothetical protein